MTPPATARSTHRSASGSRSAMRHPRRISGPARTAAAAAVAIPAPGIALPRQRPARPAVQPRRRPARRATRRPLQGAPGIALRVIDAFEGISGSSVLDRLIRGRAWIGLLAFALIGMVAMQLLVLELNTGIGHTLGRVAQLQRQNAQLGIEDSMYSAEDRVAPLAAAAGMTLAPAGTVHFVAASPVDVSRAAAALSTAVQAPASGLTGSTEAGSGASGSTGTASGEAVTSSAATAEAAGSSESPASTSSSTAPTGKTAGFAESSASTSSSTAATAETAGSAESSASTTGPRE